MTTPLRGGKRKDILRVGRDTRVKIPTRSWPRTRGLRQSRGIDQSVWSREVEEQRGDREGRVSPSMWTLGKRVSGSLMLMLYIFRRWTKTSGFHENEVRIFHSRGTCHNQWALRGDLRRNAESGRSWQSRISFWRIARSPSSKRRIACDVWSHCFFDPPYLHPYCA